MSTIRVGQIVAAFGIKGQVKVVPMTDFVERFEKGRRLMVNGEWREILAFLDHKGQIVLTLAGIKDRNDAEALQWAYCEAVEGERPELDDDEYLTSDLLGMAVIDATGRALGYIDDILPLPAHDVLVVGEIMIPAVKAFVKEIDLDGKRIRVELIDGMIES